MGILLSHYNSELLQDLVLPEAETRQQFCQHARGVCTGGYTQRRMSSTLLLVHAAHREKAESRWFVTWCWGYLRFRLLVQESDS